MLKLAENHYGKSRVRLLKVDREPSGLHHLHEWSVDVLLTGDFSACFRHGDNTGLLATDTMKNTVYAVARTSSANTPEAFALELAGFLSARNPQIGSVHIAIEAKLWTHLPLAGGSAHPSTFQQRGPELDTVSLLFTPGQPPAFTCGIQGLVILKTSHSAFAGFQRDELTTLPDTHDRLLGTEATILWNYRELPPAPAQTRAGILSALLTTFAQHDSLSVQQTLYAMAEAALDAEPLLTEITLTLPNRHNIPVDFSRFQPPFNYPSNNSLFVPTDEPSGLIHARVTR
jgi:urate oxidase